MLLRRYLLNRFFILFLTVNFGVLYACVSTKTGQSEDAPLENVKSFENIKVENKYIKVELKLASGAITKDGKIVLNLLQTNLMREDESYFFIEEEDTYLVDENGKRYALHSYNAYTLNMAYPRLGRILKLPPNVPYKVSLAFSGVNTDASTFSLVLKLGQFARMGRTPLESGSARKHAKREAIVINGIKLR